MLFIFYKGRGLKRVLNPAKELRIDNLQKTFLIRAKGIQAKFDKKPKIRCLKNEIARTEKESKLSGKNDAFSRRKIIQNRILNNKFAIQYMKEFLKFATENHANPVQIADIEYAIEEFEIELDENKKML